MNRIKRKQHNVRVNGQDTEEKKEFGRGLSNRLHFTQKAMDKYFEQYKAVFEHKLWSQTD